MTTIHTDHELSERLEGNMITASVLSPDKVEIGFEDGTWMAVETTPAAPAAGPVLPTGGVVESVRQGAGGLELKLAGGESIQIETPAAAAAPVVVLSGD